MATLHLTLADADATATLAGLIAPLLKAGDTLLLDGNIGAGKTTFARALIRARIGNPAEDVPSPTFTLVQTYDAPDVTIWHCDLYRLTHEQEVLELGLDDAFRDAICLVEWPDRLGQDTPTGALTLRLAAAADHHTLDIASAPDAAARWQPVMTALARRGT